MKNLRSLWTGKLPILGAALIWGTSFFILKNAVNDYPPLPLIAMRFTLGAALLALIFFKNIRRMTKACLWHGALLGIVYIAAFDVQTIGLLHVSPGSNAFLTASYCVWVPFLSWMVSRKRPGGSSFLAAFLMILGVGVLSLTGEGLRLGKGEAITLLSAVFYAIHIAVIARLCKDDDPIALTCMQFAFGAAAGWVITFAAGQPPAPLTRDILGSVIYLSVMCTAMAALLQIIGQRNTSASSASILLSLESVFGLLFSMIFYGETVTIRSLTGFALIFLAVLTSEGIFNRDSAVRRIGNS